MTLTIVESDELPSLTSFLSTVSPGITNLQANIHFLHEFNNPSLPKSFIWPLNFANNNANKFAKLSNTYLNVARPPLNPGPGIYESNTYVSLPYHITSLFDKVIDLKVKTNALDGGMQIGANVGAMMPDPYQLVRLNPGCLSEIITLSNESRNPFDDSNILDNQESKNPFTKLTNNFNKLLRLTSGSGSNDKRPDLNDSFHDFNDLLPCFDPNSPKSIDSDSIEFKSNNTSDNNGSFFNGKNSNGNLGTNTNPNSRYFNNLYNFEEGYFNTITSIQTSKLLVSTNVNVVNVFAIDSELNFANTHTYNTTRPYTSLLDKSGTPNNSKKNKEYQKTIEIPLLRFDLKNHLIITKMKIFKLYNKVPLLILGLNSGEIIIINLFKLTFKIISFNFNNHLTMNNPSGNSNSNSNSNTQNNNSYSNAVSLSFSSISSSSSSSQLKLSPTIFNTPVTSMEIMAHPLYDFVLIVGFANGEVMFLNPFSQEEESPNKELSKEVVDEDQFVTYFKKFGLSPFNHQKEESSIIGHIKVSHKPITCITSTISLLYPTNNNLNPMLVAIGSDDGLVKVFSLPSTYNKDYGSNTNRKTLICDVISNYFHYGLRDVKFSCDFKFLALAGDGDLIELFKLSFYNVNGLLQKNNGTGNSGNGSGSGGGGRRSRSGTVNSSSSGTQHNNTMNFLSPTATSHSTSLDISNDDSDMSLYPPAIKDISLVCRLKSHSNTTSKIDFITQEQIFTDLLEDGKQNNLLYRLISCGDDGKVIFWEFDYKALPKMKRLPKKKIPKDSKDVKDSKDPSGPKKSHPNPSTKGRNGKDPAINLSIPGSNGTSSKNNMNSILSSHSGSAINLDSTFNSKNPSHTNLGDLLTDQFKGVSGLYISLYDIRYKKHYNNLLMTQRHVNKPEDLKYDTNKFQSIIHPIVNDKLVPSIEIPVSVIDLSFWLTDGNISNIYVDAFNFWGFGKNGDIVSYKVE